MSLLSRLFGGGSARQSEPEPELYQGFRIFAEPMKESAGFRIAARIEKDIDGVVKTHQMIRADTIQSHDEALKTTLAKAKVLIDQQGEQIFR